MYSLGLQTIQKSSWSGVCSATGGPHDNPTDMPERCMTQCHGCNIKKSACCMLSLQKLYTHVSTSSSHTSGGIFCGIGEVYLWYYLYFLYPLMESLSTTILLLTVTYQDIQYYPWHWYIYTGKERGFRKILYIWFVNYLLTAALAPF